MKIAFFMDNAKAPDIDFRTPEQGNNGAGAAVYLHAALPTLIQRQHAQEIKSIILAQHVDLLPEDIETHQISGISEAARKAKALGVDFFVFRPRQNEEDNILDLIAELELPSIGRAALTPFPAHQRKMAKTPFFKALVCVGREQYDSLQDSPIFDKIVCIDNGVPIESYHNDEVIKDEKRVVYMGAMVAQKNFHLLASVWKDILRRVPEAKLSVIGSAKVYSKDAELGPWGIASAEYEEKGIIPHLADDAGRPHPSVTFHGQLGVEKNEIMQRALIGVANPGGDTETCCVSAVEIQACGTPVVSGAYYALMDAVEHNRTGLLGRSTQDLADHIVARLQDPARAKAMGQAGRDYVRGKYDFSVVCPKWVALFNALQSQNALTHLPTARNFFRHAKILRMINRPAQIFLGRLIFWPSVQEIETVVKPMVRKLLRRRRPSHS